MGAGPSGAGTDYFAAHALADEFILMTRRLCGEATREAPPRFSCPRRP